MSLLELPVPSLSRLRVAGAAVATIALLGGAAGTDARAASCRGADAKPMHASQSAIARATLCLMNGERRSHGRRVVVAIGPPIT